MRKTYPHWVLVEFTVRFSVGSQMCYLMTLSKRQHPVHLVKKKANEPPKYSMGTCVISRSPIIHPRFVYMPAYSDTGNSY